MSSSYSNYHRLPIRTAEEYTLTVLHNDANGYNQLTGLIANDNFSDARRLVDHVENPHQLDGNGLAPIHYVAMRFFSDVAEAFSLMRKLIERNCSINAVSADGTTPLHYLLSNASDVNTTLRVIGKMVEGGAETLQRNSAGDTPFNAVFSNERLSLKERLMCMNQMLMYMPVESRYQITAEMQTLSNELVVDGNMEYFEYPNS